MNARIQEADEVYVRAASVREAAIKLGLGKLEVDLASLVSGIEACGFEELPVLSRHAAIVARLPDVHRDPFDRLLVAQAMAGSFRLLTRDPTLGRYSDLVDVVA